MKYSVVTLGAALCVFVLGCQNQGLNDPAASDNNAAQTTTSKAITPSMDPSLITFNQRVAYTNIDQPYKEMQASGKISFHISESPRLSDPLFLVEIAAKGEVSTGDADRPVWSFGGSSTDRILIPGGTKVRFEKTYVVYGANVPTVLTMEFTATERTLVLRTMSLTAVKKGPLSVPQQVQ